MNVDWQHKACKPIFASEIGTISWRIYNENNDANRPTTAARALILSIFSYLLARSVVVCIFFGILFHKEDIGVCK